MVGTLTAMLHRRTHPKPVEGCFGCKVLGVNLSMEAAPSRAAGARVKEVADRERRWDRDMGAYKRMRRDGVQPKRIDGAAEVERRAEERWQVETGILPDK